MNRLESSCCLWPFCQGLLQILTSVNFTHPTTWEPEGIPYAHKKSEDKPLLPQQDWSMVSYLAIYNLAPLKTQKTDPLILRMTRTLHMHVHGWYRSSQQLRKFGGHALKSLSGLTAAPLLFPYKLWVLAQQQWEDILVAVKNSPQTVLCVEHQNCWGLY